MPENFVFVGKRDAKPVGGSLYLPLPAEIVQDLGISSGDSVSFFKDESKGTIVIVKGSNVNMDVPGLGRAKMRSPPRDFTEYLDEDMEEDSEE